MKPCRHIVVDEKNMNHRNFAKITKQDYIKTHIFWYKIL